MLRTIISTRFEFGTCQVAKGNQMGQVQLITALQRHLLVSTQQVQAETSQRDQCCSHGASTNTQITTSQHSTAHNRTAFLGLKKHSFMHRGF
ncbi:UNVERIFIED_CONTAM: hypothetical protein FKN15_019219 [Acipenser sinensis]